MKNNSKENKDKYNFPSRFGSHSSMKLADLDDGYVICVDEFGEYRTKADRLDDGTAEW